MNENPTTPTPSDKARRILAHAGRETQETAEIPVSGPGSRTPSMESAEIAAPKDFSEKAGDAIGRYHLLECIGVGGFGVVWRAEQREPIHREVALKVIKPGMDSHRIIARFQAERQALALMDHPNIAAVLDAGTTANGRPYFVMELVKGIPITDYCDEKRLKVRQRLELFIPVCKAVQHAHQKAILHRDLKPSNILIAEVDGKAVPKVIDFGISKAMHATEEADPRATMAQTIEGMVVGTPQYMSPEQAGSVHDVDTRSDIYSLGVILHELLVGDTPLSRSEVRMSALHEMLRLVREDETRKPSSRFVRTTDIAKSAASLRHTEPKKLGHALRGDLDWIVLKALDKDRSRRYDTANAFAQDLQCHLNNEPVSAGPPSARYRLRKLVKRNQLAFAAAIGILVVLTAGIVVSSWQAVRATRAEALANANFMEMAIQKLRAERREREAVQANEANKTNLHAASMADLAAGLQALREDFDATAKGERVAGFAGKSRWHEGVALLTRSLERDTENQRAAQWLHNTLFNRSQAKRDWASLELRHVSRVRTASFSPDGGKIVTASDDKTAQVWDAATGKALGEPLRHDKDVYAARFSPDGTKIVTASADQTARVWDAATGKPVGEPLRHDKDVRAARFSPDGAKIVTASHDKTARVWDAATGKAIGEPLHHDDWVNDAEFSPDGTKIVTSSFDWTARVWDAATGKAICQPLRHDDQVTAASFSPDGSMIVTASFDKTAQGWDAATGKSLGEPLHHDGSVLSASFSADGTKLVTTSADMTARVWDATNGTAIGTPLRHDKSVDAASFSADGTRIVTASADQTARVWDAATGKTLGEPLRHENSVLNASFSPDGARIVTASADMTARVWIAPTGKALGEPLRHDKGVDAASFSADGTKIVTASYDKTARAWDAATGKALFAPLLHEGAVHSANFSIDGARIVTASADKTARVWDAVTGKQLGEPLRHENSVLNASFSPDGRKIVTASEKTAQVWDATTGKPVGGSLTHKDVVVSAMFSPDGTRIVTASLDKTAVVWDAATSWPVGEPFRHKGWVMAASFSSDGTRIVTASIDHTAQVWNAKTGLPVGDPLRHEDQVMAASFSPDGTKLVTVTNTNKTARVWDAATGKAVGEPLPHEDAVLSVSFSPDNTKVVTASADRTARVWAVPTAREEKQVAHISPAVLQWARAVAGLSFNEDGEFQTKPDKERRDTIALASLPPGPWEELAQWLKADIVGDAGASKQRGELAQKRKAPPTGRTLSPASNRTRRQIAEHERDFAGTGTVESLQSALCYDPTVPLARFLLVTALENAEAGKKPETRDPCLPQCAAHLRRYDLDRLPNDVALQARATQLLRDLPPDTPIGIGPTATTARAEADRIENKTAGAIPNSGEEKLESK